MRGIASPFASKTALFNVSQGCAENYGMEVSTGNGREFSLPVKLVTPSELLRKWGLPVAEIIPALVCTSHCNLH